MYLFLVTLFVVLIVFHRHNPRQNRFAPGGSGERFKTIDDVINDRKSWQPILPGWQQKPVGDFAFTALDAAPGRLHNLPAGQTVVLVWASWYPACKMQLIHLCRALSQSSSPVSVVAVTPEPRETILEFPVADYPDIIFVTVTTLPEPFSLPGSVPAVFFLDADRRLKLAAEGLVPTAHILPILDLDK